MIEKNKVIIRRPKKQELDKIKEFFKLVLKDTLIVNGISNVKGLLDEEINDKDFRINQDFNSNGKDRYFLFAEYDSKIIGSIEYGLTSELLNTGSNNELQYLYEIGTVFVLPKYQRQGVISLLFVCLFKKLEAIGEKEVCFDSGYKIAQQIWIKKFGNPAYYLKDYWGDDAHLMVWRINIKEAQKLFK